MTASVDAGQQVKTPFFKNPRRVIPLLAVIALLVVGIFVKDNAPVHVSLAPEKILYGGPDWLTNTWITTIVVDLIRLAPGRAQRVHQCHRVHGRRAV